MLNPSALERIALRKIRLSPSKPIVFKDIGTPTTFSTHLRGHEHAPFIPIRALRFLFENINIGQRHQLLRAHTVVDLRSGAKQESTTEASSLHGGNFTAHALRLNEERRTNKVQFPGKASTTLFIHPDVVKQIFTQERIARALKRGIEPETIAWWMKNKPLAKQVMGEALPNLPGPQQVLVRAFLKKR